MATKWSGQKVDKSTLNNGNEYDFDSGVAMEELNSIVNNSLYASNISENVANQLAGLGANDKVEFKGSNPNLLINGDFSINQRGKPNYGSGVYGVDRWRIQTGTVVVNSDSIDVSISGGWNYFYQIIENVIPLRGKTVTLSVKFKNVSYTNGTPRIGINDGSSVVSSNIPNGFSGIVTVSKTISDTATTLQARPLVNFQSESGSDLIATLEWAKLEIGSVATPFSPRPYAEELALCSRYFQRVRYYKKASDQWGYYEPFALFHTPMRTTPTVIQMYAVDGNGVVSSNEKTVFDITDNSELVLNRSRYGYSNRYGTVLANGEATFIQYHLYYGELVLDAEM